jgi:hypothetical protein
MIIPGKVILWRHEKFLKDLSEFWWENVKHKGGGIKRKPPTF